jgi:A/G-specific adenine glycosylase
VRAEADGDPDAIGIDVNIRRVCERVDGTALSVEAAERTARRLARPLRGRERLLALMDLGALVCTARDPNCPRCPLRRRCATRGVRSDERTSTQGRYEGSFRQRRGAVLARLRSEALVPLSELDPVALSSLVDDGLAIIDETRQHARLPGGRHPDDSGGQVETG